MKTISIISLVMLGLFSQCNKKNEVKQPSEASLSRIPIQSTVDNKERDFFLYLPKGYHSEPEKKFPVLMFLHGNGERGNGKDQLDYVMIHGPLYEAWIQKRDLPFIMIVPQLPMFGMDKKGLGYIDNRDTSWIPKRLVNGTPRRNKKGLVEQPMSGVSQSDTFPNGIKTLPDGWDKCDEDLMKMFGYVFENHRADKKRVYLSGLSYGGFGTWAIANKHPKMFAAINPIVGWGHPDYMDPIAANQIPIWAFAGGRDNVVPVKYFYKGLNKLESLGHKDVRFTIESDMGHDTWTRVYAGEDLYNWFLSKSRE